MLEVMIEEVIRQYKEYKRLGDIRYITELIVRLILDSLHPYIQKYDENMGKVIRIAKKPYIRRNDKRRMSVSRFI